MNFYFLHESIIKQRWTSKTQEQIWGGWNYLRLMRGFEAAWQANPSDGRNSG